MFHYAHRSQFPGETHELYLLVQNVFLIRVKILIEKTYT